MTEFTPLSAAIGGLLIGLASALLLFANGRVAGISGILGQAMWPAAGRREDGGLPSLRGSQSVQPSSPNLAALSKHRLMRVRQSSS